MGGSKSQEFTALAEAGEDGVILCEKCGYAANIELASRQPAQISWHESGEPTKLEKVPTPGKKSVKDVTHFFKYSLTSQSRSRSTPL